MDIQTAKKALDRLQRTACLCMTGVKNTVATSALEALLNLPPLDLYVKALTFNTAMNIQGNGWWIHHLPMIGHARICELIDNEVLKMPNDVVKADLMLEDGFVSLIPAKQEWLGADRRWPPEQGVICYTDASVYEGHSGVGIFCESPEVECSVSTGAYTSVEQAELFAIIEIGSLQGLRGISGRDIYICTDSESVIKKVSSHVVRSNLVMECKQVLNELSVLNKVTLLWVPSHAGIPGNVKADRLAKTGAKNRFVGPEPRFGISRASKKAIVRECLREERLREEHLRAWLSYEGARHTKIFCRNSSASI